MPIKLRVVGKTDKGLVRPANEDCLHLDHENQVYGVCDGMGGHQAGEVAALLASDTLRMAFGPFRGDLLSDPLLQLNLTLPGSADLLVKAVRLANRAVQRHAGTNEDLSGMGTTIVAAAFEADLMCLSHVGDSRAYRVMDRAIEPLTVDHSWLNELQATQQISAAEATALVGRNIITRAIGVREAVDVDIRLIKVKPGDTFLFCSDGLCGYVDDPDIAFVLGKARGNLEQMAASLVQLANDRGGSDNVTVVLAEVLEIVPSTMPEMPAMTVAAEIPEVVAAENRWLERIESATVKHTDEPPATSSAPSPKPNKLFLYSIFAVFAVVAALVWIFTGK